LALDEVKTLIRDTLCVGERMLTPEEVAEVEKIEQQYLCEDFIKQIQ
jgi:lipoic acid synthetase/lipoate-protein ligase A